MRKTLQTRRNTLYMILTLFIASMTLASIQPTYAAYTKLSVEPSYYEAPEPGRNFTISIVITNVTRLGAIQFKLGYNTTLLDAVWCSLTPISETYLSDYVPSPWNATSGIVDASGYVVFGAIVMDLDNPFTGSGAILNINFTATAVGSGILDIYETVIQGISPEWEMYPIEHDVVDGAITVVPEFSALLVMPLLMILTLVATSLGKTVWSRKRKNSTSNN